MFGRLRSPLRHPFYPELPATHALTAKGRHTALAGSYHELAQAATRGARASHAVFVLQAEDGPPAALWQRDRLWEWFRVPSYILVLDERGRPKAYECEAQEGLHVAAATGSAELDTSLCPCGRPGPRSGVVAKRPPQSERSLPAARTVSA
jgi:hypothetical protein